jgi:hypothetical protein
MLYFRSYIFLASKKDKIVIGRHPDSDIVYKDVNVSRSQCTYLPNQIAFSMSREKIRGLLWMGMARSQVDADYGIFNMIQDVRERKSSHRRWYDFKIGKNYFQG